MTTQLVTAEAEAEAVRHAEAVGRALARRGMSSIDEYREEQARRQAGRAEAEADTAASQARRLTAAPRLAETDSGQIRRGQWIEADASLLQTVRRRAWRLLPWHTAEEMAAEVITAELEAGREAGKPGCVRAERLTAAYLGLTAKDWQTGREARRLAEMAETPDSLADVLADERADVAAEAEAEAAEAEAGAEVSAASVYRQAVGLARRLWLTADMPVVACFSQAVSGLTGAELAKLWNVSASAWKRAAAEGGREVQASYPDGAELMRRLLPADLNYARRQTGADGRQVRYDVGAVQVEADGLNYWRRQHVSASRARRIGADLPAIGRMRSAAQLDREADLLLSRPQLPGRRPTVGRASTGASRVMAAPDHWQTERPLALADMLAPLRRLLAAKLAAEAPRQDGRKRPGTSAAPGIPAGLASLMTAAPDMPAETGSAKLAPRRTGTAAEVLAWLAGAEAEADGWLRLAAWAEAPLDSADRPRLPIWRPGQARRRQAVRPSAVRLAAEASLAAVSAAEAAEAGRQGARPYLAAHGASVAARDRADRRLWRMVFNVPADRRGAWLAAPMCSLDVATAAEHTAEQARPYLTAAEMAAEAEAEQAPSGQQTGH